MNTITTSANTPPNPPHNDPTALVKGEFGDFLKRDEAYYVTAELTKTPNGIPYIEVSTGRNKYAIVNTTQMTAANQLPNTMPFQDIEQRVLTSTLGVKLNTVADAQNKEQQAEHQRVETETRRINKEIEEEHKPVKKGQKAQPTSGGKTHRFPKESNIKTPISYSDITTQNPADIAATYTLKDYAAKEIQADVQPQLAGGADGNARTSENVVGSTIAKEGLSGFGKKGDKFVMVELARADYDHEPAQSAPLPASTKTEIDQAWEVIHQEFGATFEKQGVDLARSEFSFAKRNGVQYVDIKTQNGDHYAVVNTNTLGDMSGLTTDTPLNKMQGAIQNLALAETIENAATNNYLQHPRIEQTFFGPLKIRDYPTRLEAPLPLSYGYGRWEKRSSENLTSFTQKALKKDYELPKGTFKPTSEFLLAHSNDGIDGDAMTPERLIAVAQPNAKIGTFYENKDLNMSEEIVKNNIIDYSENTLALIKIEKY